MSNLICTQCNTTYSIDDVRWKCECGSPLDIELEPAFDLDRIGSRKPTMWRYREAIPVRDDAHIISFDEGFTPLTRVETDGSAVLFKQDHLFPTGSYKDRGASALISKVGELGIEKVVEDSSGNAGCAVAAYCAKAGIACDIYVPGSTSPGKLVQIDSYGARLLRIPGSREDTASAVLAAAEADYYASHSWNPFFFQGTKTFAFEVCEQLGWKAPDSVVLPVGNGTLLLGAAIGFRELVNAGITGGVPKLIAVQSSHCAPLYKAFKQESSEVPSIEKKDTIAEGIAIAEPIRGSQILSAVRESGGEFLTVEETEISESLKDIFRKGYYIEPTSAATIAGLKKYLAKSEPDAIVVSVFTGHGLKSTGKILKLLAG